MDDEKEKDDFIRLGGDTGNEIPQITHHIFEMGFVEAGGFAAAWNADLVHAVKTRYTADEYRNFIHCVEVINREFMRLLKGSIQ